MSRSVWLPIVIVLLAGVGCRSESEPPAKGESPARVDKFVWEVGAGDGTALRCVRDEDGERCRLIQISSASSEALSSSMAADAVRSYLRADTRGAVRSVDCGLRENSDRVLCDVDFETTCDVVVVSRRGADLLVKHPAHSLCFHAVA